MFADTTSIHRTGQETSPDEIKVLGRPIEITLIIKLKIRDTGHLQNGEIYNLLAKKLMIQSKQGFFHCTSYL